MMKNWFSRVLATCFCALFLSACGKNATDEVDIGTVKDSVYRNQYFGLTLNIPSGWNVQDQAMSQKLASKGADLMAGDDQNLKAQMKASEKQTVKLLAVFQHPLGSPVKFNPNIMSSAERVVDAPGIKSGQDYLYRVKNVIQSGQMKFDIDDNFTTEKHGGVEFSVLRSSLKMGTLKINQSYYVAITKGYALSFILTYTSPDEESILKKVVESISFH